MANAPFAEQPFDFVSRHARQRPFLRRHGFDNPLGRRQPAAQDFRLDGFGQVFVGAGVQTFDNVFFCVTAGEHHHVREGQGLTSFQTPADFDAIHFRHLPIQDGKPGSVRQLQNVPSLSAVFGDHRLESPRDHILFEHLPPDRIVFCDEDFHDLPSLANSRSNAEISRSMAVCRSCHASSKSETSPARPIFSIRSAAS